MSTILYLHGFLSSPQSHKCQITQTWLHQQFPQVNFVAPSLSSYPGQAQQTLLEVMNDLADEKVYVIGSSLGGFWATYLVETQRVERAVLINPGVMPQDRFHEFIGQRLKSFYSDAEYCLSKKDIDDLAACDTQTITQHDKIWLMVQTKDETLDYRLAVEKYRNCKQLVEEGGNHSFAGYENWLPDIMAFFKITK